MSWLSKNERDSRHPKTESPVQWIGQAVFVCHLKRGWIIRCVNGPVLSLRIFALCYFFFVVYFFQRD